MSSDAPRDSGAVASASAPPSRSPTTHVIILASTVPAASERAGAPPLALETHGAATLLDAGWARLARAGLADPARVWVATNATFYKYFEVWSFGHGLELSHVVNSGRSLGDARVDWHTLRLLLRRVARDEPAADVLLLPGDALPPPDFSLDDFLAAARAAAADASSLLLQTGARAGAAGAPPAAGGGPVVMAHVASVAAGGGAPAVGGPPAKVLAVTPSARAAGGGEPAVTDAAAFAAPLLLFLRAADVARLAAPGAPDALLAHDDDGAADALTTGAAAGVAAEALVPVEAAVDLLAREGRVVGHATAAPFLVGALDGRPHAVPPPPPGAPPHAPSPFAHALPAFLAAAPAPAPAAALDGPGTVHARAYARVGVMGNPSDGYGGKTLSVTVANFRADAWLVPNAEPADGRVTLLPHPFYDPLTFGSIGHVSVLAMREGYSGGVRLMMAALHRFSALAAARGFSLARAPGFRLRYHTTVPRQVGLAGSSAILTALIRALLRHYGLGDEAAADAALGLTRDTLPNFVLSVESEELGITAGLQDRVVQAYEGAVHMDFEPEASKRVGHGRYTRVPVAALPPLFLAYAADPSDSGRIHAPVKQRWLAGDPDVIAGMSTIAGLADAALELCASTPYGGAASCAAAEAVAAAWATVMANNFNARRALFGDAALGADNIRMIEIARETGASGKFPGSGGAILGVVDVMGVEAKGRLPPGTPRVPPRGAAPAEQAAAAAARVAAATRALRAAYHAEGYVFVRLQPHEAGPEGPGVVPDEGS